MVTVGALLQMPELRLTAHRGAGLASREVTRAYVTELPDPSRYLSGGELVISGLLWWSNERGAETFVGALAAHGAAALAASCADVGGTMPHALLRACEQHGVPLVEVPADLSFAVITERVVLALAAERGELEQPAGAAHRELLAAAASGGLDALLHSGSRQLGVPCWVRSATGRVVAGTEGGDALRVPVPNTATASPLGWSLVLDAAQPPGGAAVLEELAALVGMERARVERARRAESRSAAGLLRVLARGTTHSGELATALAGAGLPVDRPLRVLLGCGTGLRVDAAVALLDDLLAELGVTGVAGAVDGDVYAVARVGSRWPGDAVRRAERVLHAAGPALGDGTLVLAVSGPATAGGLLGAVAEARQAVRLGHRRGPAVQVVAGDEIAAHHLLLAGAPDELRSALRTRLLGPVADYDRAHGGELLGSLRAFLECSGSWRAAAGRLHVHVNTLRYRIRRVEQLLGVDLACFADRVDLYLALQIENV